MIHPPTTAARRPGRRPALGARLVAWRRARPRGWRGALLAALLAAHLAVSLFAVVPGYLSIDEGTYHFMVANLARGRPFEVWNGYRELPSPELAAAATLVPVDGRLVAVPPELFTLIAWPFYAAWGYRGLFLLEALAFVGVAALTARVARRLAGERAVVPSVLLLALATFAWEYSQAAWPHALSALLVAAAFAATVEALERTGSGRVALVALAGLAGGLAVGVRLDSILALAALALPLLFARPPDGRGLLALAAGSAVPLTALGGINRYKFGTWSPLSYGPVGAGGEVVTYLPAALAALAVLAAVWTVSRPGVRARLAGRTGPAAAAAAGAAALAVLLSPSLRGVIFDALAGAWQLVVDFRVRPEIPEPALSRTPGGAMVYLGAVKKSLLQSCPWMVALALPIVGAVHGEDRRAVLLLLPIPAAYLGFYSASAWHGGLALNLRYWLPALPMLAVLGGLAWVRLTGGLGARFRAATAALAAALAAAYLAVLRPWTAADLPAQEAVYLSLPLALAAGLAGLVALLAVRRRAAPGLRACAAAAFVLCAAWAGLAAFGYDFPRHRKARAVHLEQSRRAAAVVRPDSILFASYPDPFFGLIETPGVRLAVPGRDRFADFRRLVDFHLDAGRPVYASFPADWWRGLAGSGRLAGLAGRPLTPDGFVVELRRDARPPATAAEGAASQPSDGPATRR